MKMTNQEYSKFSQKYMPPSKSYINIPVAFLIGGLICVIGEATVIVYTMLGLERELASASMSITLVFAAALLTGIGVFDDIAKHAGAGTLVPITGFANAVAAPAIEFKSEGIILGTGAKMFVIAGPVIVYGISASIVYGVIIYLFKLY
ncbi:MAG: stage V sporulation protein AC [Oscillospiraceae bacterium]